jgi:hypothetical protein
MDESRERDRRDRQLREVELLMGYLSTYDDDAAEAVHHDAAGSAPGSLSMPPMRGGRGMGGPGPGPQRSANYEEDRDWFMDRAKWRASRRRIREPEAAADDRDRERESQEQATRAQAVSDAGTSKSRDERAGSAAAADANPGGFSVLPLSKPDAAPIVLNGAKSALGVSMKLGGSGFGGAGKMIPLKRPATSMQTGAGVDFGAESDDDELGSKKKRTLTRLEYTEEELLAAGLTLEQMTRKVQEDRRQAISQLIESLPTKKEDLWAYRIKWDAVPEVSEGDFWLSPWPRKLF